MADFNFFHRHFNQRPRQDKIWRMLFLLLGLGIFLFFLIRVVAPALKPQWREIKNSSQAETIFQSANPQIGFSQGSFNDAAIAGENDSINFLLLGAAGKGYDAPDLTDTILVARLLPFQNKIYLFSLPRDLWVKIPELESWTKLNALYALAKKNKGHEFDLLKQKVQDITGLAIEHYVLVNLDTVKDLVDSVSGVNVMVKKDIYDTAYPGPNHTYQTFAISAGWRYLDGETALKYIRSRHSAGGDFDRIERQQEILQALKQKVLSLGLWDIPTFFSIFNAVTSQIKTDLGFWQIKDFWDKIKDIPAENVIKTEIDTPTLVITNRVILDNQVASTVQPKAGLENYGEIQKYIAEKISNF